MRYFIYKDSQISGPFSREELAQISDLRPETLVCEEGISGGHDGDWKAIDQISELAELDAPSAVSLAQRPPSWEGQSPGGVAGDRGAVDEFEPADLPDWDTLWVKSGESAGALSLAESKIQDLNQQLDVLRARLSNGGKGGGPEPTKRVRIPTRLNSTMKPNRLWRWPCRPRARPGS